MRMSEIYYAEQDRPAHSTIKYVSDNSDRDLVSESHRWAKKRSGPL